MNNSELRAALEYAMNEAKAKRDRWKKEHPDQPEMPECPLCGGTGLERFFQDIDGHPIDYEHRNDPRVYEYVAPCRCIKAGMSEQYKADKRFSDVPNLYADATFKTFQTDIYKKVDSKQLAAIAKNDAQMYVTKFEKFADLGMGLYIWSKARGSGKSRLASTVANELTFKGIRNKFVGEATLLSEIQGSWNDKSVSTFKLLESYIKPKILIIDDFGEHDMKPWVNDNMYDLIDRRYKDKKPTIITSNYDVLDLPYNTRITDRITHWCKNIRMPNESIRQLQRNDVDDIFNRIVRGEDDE